MESPSSGLLWSAEATPSLGLLAAGVPWPSSALSLEPAAKVPVQLLSVHAAATNTMHRRSGSGQGRDEALQVIAARHGKGR